MFKVSLLLRLAGFLGFLRSASPGEASLGPCRDLILRSALFLGELELAAQDTDLSRAASATPLQQKVLAYISDYLSAKQDAECSRAVALLKRVVREMKGFSLEDGALQGLREAAAGLLETMSSSHDQNRIPEEVGRRFGTDSGAFCRHLKSAVSSSMDAIWSASETGDAPRITRTLVALASASVEAYIAILSSVAGASWGSSNSFDETDIRLTRPGFGVIALFRPGQSIHRIRDLSQPLMLLRTRDAMVHMTVFQVFLTFDRDRYDPRSLPTNLLALFKAYMDAALEGLFDEVGSQVSSQAVRLSGNRLVLGRDYPSHLVTEVECREVSEALWRLKERSNDLGLWWMAGMADELRGCGFEGEVAPGPTGAVLRGRGWRLIIGYTSNEDYKTHITLGVLKSGDQRYDDLVVRANAGAERKIRPVFSPDAGKTSNTEMAAELEEAKVQMRSRQLRSMVPSELSDYPLLREQVARAKEGEQIELGADVLKEWLTLKGKDVDRALGAFEEERYLYVSGIHESVINMDRIQNFEVVQAANPVA